jgi:hypothetical protein
MIKGTDKISDFPKEFNKLEKKVVEELSRNAHGIKIAMWVTAISTSILAIVSLVSCLY